MQLLIYFLILTTIFSCATLSKDECKNGDWQAIGLKDGLEGAPLSKLSEHQKACSEYKIKINTTDYSKARLEGLKSYCEPENGLKVGLNGFTYHGVCNDSKFNKNYKIGSKIYGYKSQLNQFENDLEDAENQLDKEGSDKSYYKSKIKNLKNDIRRTESKLLVLKASVAKDAADFIDLLD